MPKPAQRNLGDLNSFPWERAVGRANVVSALLRSGLNAEQRNEYNHDIIPDDAGRDTAQNETTSERPYCNIVMKGGITSGVVYPRAVAELAEKYRLRTSAGQRRSDRGRHGGRGRVRPRQRRVPADVGPRQPSQSDPVFPLPASTVPEALVPGDAGCAGRQALVPETGRGLDSARLRLLDRIARRHGVASAAVLAACGLVTGQVVWTRVLGRPSRPHTGFDLAAPPRHRS